MAFGRSVQIESAYTVLILIIMNVETSVSGDSDLSPLLGTSLSTKESRALLVPMRVNLPKAKKTLQPSLGAGCKLGSWLCSRRGRPIKVLITFRYQWKHNVMQNMSTTASVPSPLSSSVQRTKHTVRSHSRTQSRGRVLNACIAVRIIRSLSCIDGFCFSLCSSSSTSWLYDRFRTVVLTTASLITPSLSVAPVRPSALEKS